jgi:DNA invertase Pin-like site-specific DNA recombinase
MIAAIYARKSTDQVGVADDQRSVVRQIEHATAFAARQGWRVDPDRLFVDDGISGAIFGAGRPGLMRLLNALTPRPAFDVLVMAEESRLGREMHQTAHLFGEIIRSGVRVFFYLDERERTLDTAVDKMMLSLTTFSAELEREKARQRTKDAMLRKAKAGHVTGGRVFGYDNVRLENRVERRINDREAAVIRRIFELAALGHGLRVIAHTLNAEGYPSPRPQCGRPAGWAPSTVRDVLVRPIYRGVIEWDRARRNGERRQLRRDNNPAPLQVEAPHLRIVDADIVATVDQRRRQRGNRYQMALNANPARDEHPRQVKYVLTGLIRCACGANFEAQSAIYGRRKGGVYLCSAARRKGPAVCTSDLHLPIAETDTRILDAVEHHLLDADVFTDVLDLAVRRLTADTDQIAAWLAERDRLDRELINLAGAIAAGSDVPTLLAEMRHREARKREIASRVRQPHADVVSLRATLAARLADWKALLRSRPVHGQRVLKTLLDGPITLGQRTAEGVRWEAHASINRMLETLSFCVASPAGFATHGQGPSVGLGGMLLIAA